jgi:hypothetical protein
VEQFLAGVAVAAAIAGGVAAKFITRRHSRGFAERVGSFQNLLRQVDRGRLRRIKVQDGDLSAVHALRKEFPGVPLADARRVVNML